MSCVLVTGANGFIGKNLIVALERMKDIEILKYDVGSTEDDLKEYISRSDFIFHLAGVNRTKNPEEFKAGNEVLTAKIINEIKKNDKAVPLLLSSSIQADNDNPYGISKKYSENIVLNFARETGKSVYVYRLPNVFGKWCKPNYNSVVATWCYNIARNLPVIINNQDTMLELVYIDDVIKDFIDAYYRKKEIEPDGFCKVQHTYKIKLERLKEIIFSFKESRESLKINDLSSDFIKSLYATYLSYLPEQNFNYELQMKYDNRGYLAEFIKSTSFGQIFVSRTKPGITRGNHFHDRKIEKFLVVAGKAQIKLRDITGENTVIYNVQGNKLEVIDIPVGYTHSISNVGNEDVITIFWADEIFDSKRPDTYFLEV